MKELLRKTGWASWLILVFVFPFTSLPTISKIVHTSSVAPASLVFAIVLLLVWLPGFIKNRGTFPPQLRILLYFVAAALITTFLAFFREVPAYKENSLLAAVFEGIVTLGIGVVFYLLTAGLPQDEEKLKSTLRALNLGGALMLVWALLQLYFTFHNGRYPQWLYQTQIHLSTTRLFNFRATGFASEPSWLAHQLNMVYLPYWLAASLRNFSVHKYRLFGKISAENIFLISGLVILVGTFSRVGIAAFVMVIAFLFLRANRAIIRRISLKWQISARKVLFSILLTGAFILAYAGLLTGGLFVLSKVDKRMATVFDLNGVSGLVDYAESLQFGERLIYWQTGWNIYDSHPLIGVGLGTAGFYFPQEMPDSGWQLTETRRLIYNSTGLLNIKNLWVRILAETGIVGFSLFLLFLIVEGITSWKLTNSKSPVIETVGWMGIFMLIAFPLEGFSVDTFALPFYWFTLGLISAGWMAQQKIEKESPVMEIDG